MPDATSTRGHFVCRMRPARGAERRGKRQIHQQKARGPARAMGQVWAAQRGGRAHKEADLVAPRPTPGRRKIKFSLVRNLSRYCSYLFSFVFNCGPHNSRARCSLRLHVNHCGTRPPRPPLCSSRLPPRPHADAAGHLLARAHHARLARAYLHCGAVGASEWHAAALPQPMIALLECVTKSNN